MTQRATTPCITGAALSPATRSHNPVGEPNPSERVPSRQTSPLAGWKWLERQFDETTVRSASLDWKVDFSSRLSSRDKRLSRRPEFTNISMFGYICLLLLLLLLQPAYLSMPGE